MSFLPFHEGNHVVLLYENEQQRDNEIIHFINDGLAHGQLCVYGTVYATNREYFKTLSSRITDYDDNIKNGNLLIVDFVPFYNAALEHDLRPYKKVQKQLEEMLKRNKDIKVRYLGDATGHLFKSRHFQECFMIEDWYQVSRLKVVSTLCMFQRSLMDESPFHRHKNHVVHAHDLVINSHLIAADLDQDPIPTLKLRDAFMKLDVILGKTFCEELIEELAHGGIDLSSRTESYFLHEIQESLDLVFGLDAAQLVMGRLKKSIT